MMSADNNLLKIDRHDEELRRDDSSTHRVTKHSAIRLDGTEKTVTGLLKKTLKTCKCTLVEAVARRVRFG